MALKWEGEKVKKKLTRAVIHGINDTMSQCAAYAKNNHPWQNRTGILEGKIRPVEMAREQGGRIVGVWGVTDSEYALPLELGTFKMKPYPYLRPAADFHYPKLAKRIGVEFKRGEVFSR